MSALLAEKAGALSRLSATDACGRGAVGDADTMHSQPLFVGVVSDIGAGNVGDKMALKLRPTGLGAGIDKDRPDYTIYTGEWEIGRIYQSRGRSR